MRGDNEQVSACGIVGRFGDSSACVAAVLSSQQSIGPLSRHPIGIGKLLSNVSAFPRVSQIHSKIIEPSRFIKSFVGWTMVVAPQPEWIVFHKVEPRWSK
jgi:hypothetical protein